MTPSDTFFVTKKATCSCHVTPMLIGIKKYKTVPSCNGNIQSPFIYVNTFRARCLNFFFCRKKNKRIHRVLSLSTYLNDNLTPDVETLQLPFQACKKIFLHLSLQDLANCMLVCKEWRSLIDTCAFWRLYTDYHYNFMPKKPERASPLAEWKYNASCLRTRHTVFVHNKPVVQAKYIFRPFPDCCACGIVVPYTMTPPDGGLGTYHTFLQAIDLVKQLRDDLDYFKQFSRIEVVLFQWFKQNLPSSKEVLELFNCHPDIIASCDSARALTQTEFKNSYQKLMMELPGQGLGLPRLSYELFCHISDWVQDCVLIFETNRNVVLPAPCFILTPLCDGWMGGIMYAQY